MTIKAYDSTTSLCNYFYDFQLDMLSDRDGYICSV